MSGHYKDLCHSAYQRIGVFNLFTNFGHYKEKFADEKEVGFCWEDKVSYEQTRAKQNSNFEKKYGKFENVNY